MWPSGSRPQNDARGFYQNSLLRQGSRANNPHGRPPYLEPGAPQFKQDHIGAEWDGANTDHMARGLGALAQAAAFVPVGQQLNATYKTYQMAKHMRMLNEYRQGMNQFFQKMEAGEINPTQMLRNMKNQKWSIGDEFAVQKFLFKERMGKRWDNLKHIGSEIRKSFSDPVKQPVSAEFNSVYPGFPMSPFATSSAGGEGKKAPYRFAENPEGSPGAAPSHTSFGSYDAFGGSPYNSIFDGIGIFDRR